jgi:nucleolar MIF4G domain-containing protein 1
MMEVRENWLQDIGFWLKKHDRHLEEKQSVRRSPKHTFWPSLAQFSTANRHSRDTKQQTHHLSSHRTNSPLSTMAGKIMTEIRGRKTRRKHDRQNKKKRRRVVEDNDDEEPEPEKKTAKKASTQKNVDDDGAQKASKSKKPKREKASKDEPQEEVDEGPYAGMDSTLAAALRKEDAEIADLEGKLGLGNKKDKSRLHKEYAKLEGYGDDFGDFLDDLDTMVMRVADGESDDEDGRYQSDDEDDFSEPDEEMVPMKGAPIRDDDEDSVDDDDDEQGSDGEQDDEIRDDDHYNDSDDEDSPSDEENEVDAEDRDHNVADTYKPSQGEDIYGHSTTEDAAESKPTKYVPPHLRNREDSQDRQEKLLALRRLLNNALNRLSEDTLTSVVQSVSKLYHDYPTSDVNEFLWKNVVSAAVDRPILMSGMIPVYVACLAGVHFQTGETVQLGGHLIEQMICRLMKVRKEESEEESKEASNLILCICYMYNFGLVHSGFMFDIVRTLIESFSELDIELLLLILSHSGHALRSDDPSALKEIVLSVQTKHQSNSDKSTSSRVEFMISAMGDLKNNKRRKQDSVFSDRSAKLRKLLGRIKSDASRSSDSSCLRIRLRDILDAETKGRWWKVGASWVGNQFKHQSEDGDEDDAEGNKASKSPGRDEDEEELLKLAAKYRMNTDSRRAIFCIIMGSADCDDAFEKLVRAGLLKNKTERDCVRVLMECCGNEKFFNPFYSHLASRICDYQPQCKFTFQLAFWDTFKQWESVALRKAANLSKLLYHLVAEHQSLKLSMLKPLDMGNLDETALIFMTIFFSTMFESIEDPTKVFELFQRGIPKPKPGHEEDAIGLRESLSVFFLQTLKASPKNKKGSQFRVNLKAAIKACETNELDTMVPAADE